MANDEGLEIKENGWGSLCGSNVGINSLRYVQEEPCYPVARKNHRTPLGIGPFTETYIS